ncbi:16462_t:CDS:2 [Funneliformis caledonium]|uniref:16462_t:CDS:1 n=1 Tax=Funneliformis caledonium TaxID=1117310 RepID=A0A9N9A9A2_9GLOM|nr:16462_t:CDS:2 [Funneliformis caledonium]
MLNFFHYRIIKPLKFRSESCIISNNKETANEDIELSFIKIVRRIDNRTIEGISDETIRKINNRTVRGISDRTVGEISSRTVREISGRTIGKTCIRIEVIRRDIVEVELIFLVILSKTSNSEPVISIRECIISLEISIPEKKRSLDKTSKAIEYN